MSCSPAWSYGTHISGQDSQSVLDETAMVITMFQYLFAHRQSSAAVASVRSVVVANMRHHLDVMLRPIVIRRSSISLEKVSERLKHLAVPKFDTQSAPTDGPLSMMKILEVVDLSGTTPRSMKTVHFM